MGAVQRLATMVIVGLVALSTILVLYLADESNRIKAEEKDQQDAAIERGTANYLSQCLRCHGPAGEGAKAGDGRIGLPLNTTENQYGVNADGTPISGGVDGRTAILTKTIHEGRGGIMPAWGEENGGPLNSEQINELVTMIQHADWNKIYNEAVTEAGGYPTAPAANTPATTPAPQPSEPNTYNVALEDIRFDVTELTVPANTDITINLVNNGAGTHNFNIDALNVHSGDYSAGQTGKVTFNTGAPGEYEFYCAIPGHKEAGMVGKLIVTDKPIASAPASGASASPASGEGSASAAPATEFHVEMKDIAFAETELTVPANTDITIKLTNTGAGTHNFSIDELGVDSGELAGGQAGEVKFNTGAPGEYTFYCDIPGHKEAGMVGKLKVVEGGAAPAADSGSSAPPSGEAAPAGNAAAEPLHVEMKDIAFAETTLTVPANSEVTVNLTNTGAASHNFSIPELGVDSGELAAGQTGTVTIKTGAPGEYTYFCDVPGHKEAGMVGKLIVQ